MSDRHIHCVYFQYDNENKLCGFCLLKMIDIGMGFKQGCEHIVLKPEILLSYFLKHNHYCKDWECADKKAINYLNKTGFNSYPHQVEFLTDEDEKAIDEYLQIVYGEDDDE